MINCREEFEDWLSSEIAEEMEYGIFDKSSLGFYKKRTVHESWIAWKSGWKRHEELTE